MAAASMQDLYDYMEASEYGVEARIRGNVGTLTFQHRSGDRPPLIEVRGRKGYKHGVRRWSVHEHDLNKGGALEIKVGSRYRPAHEVLG